MAMRRGNALLDIVLNAPDINQRRSAQPRAHQAFKEVGEKIQAAQTLLRRLLDSDAARG